MSRKWEAIFCKGYFHEFKKSKKKCLIARFNIGLPVPNFIRQVKQPAILEEERDTGKSVEIGGFQLAVLIEPRYVRHDDGPLYITLGE